MIKDIGTEYPKCKRCGSSTHMEKNGLGHGIICCNKCEWLYNVEQTAEILKTLENVNRA